jgi:hypothetical protein
LATQEGVVDWQRLLKTQGKKPEAVIFLILSFCWSACFADFMRGSLPHDFNCYEVAYHEGYQGNAFIGFTFCDCRGCFFSTVCLADE